MRLTTLERDIRKKIMQSLTINPAASIGALQRELLMVRLDIEAGNLSRVEAREEEMREERWRKREKARLKINAAHRLWDRRKRIATLRGQGMSLLDVGRLVRVKSLKRIEDDILAVCRLADRCRTGEDSLPLSKSLAFATLPEVCRLALARLEKAEKLEAMLRAEVV